MPAPKDAVEAYLASLDPPQRAALERVRKAILAAAAGATEGMSYGMPAVFVDGRAVAGYAAFKGHLSLFPHSGTVLQAFGDELEGWTGTKGTLRFTVEKPLPITLVKRIVRARIAEMRGTKGR